MHMQAVTLWNVCDHELLHALYILLVENEDPCRAIRGGAK